VSAQLKCSLRKSTNALSRIPTFAQTTATGVNAPGRPSAPTAPDAPAVLAFAEYLRNLVSSLDSVLAVVDSDDVHTRYPVGNCESTTE